MKSTNKPFHSNGHLPNITHVWGSHIAFSVSWSYIWSVRHKYRINAHKHPCLEWDSNHDLPFSGWMKQAGSKSPILILLYCTVYSGRFFTSYKIKCNCMKQIVIQIFLISVGLCISKYKYLMIQFTLIKKLTSWRCASFWEAFSHSVTEEIYGTCRFVTVFTRAHQWSLP
jgi:hypothetical protein